MKRVLWLIKYIYMITLPYEIVYESVTFIFLGGKLPTSLLNVTRLPKRSPTDLLLVEEKYRVDNTKSFVWDFNYFFNQTSLT